MLDLKLKCLSCDELLIYNVRLYGWFTTCINSQNNISCYNNCYEFDLENNLTTYFILIDDRLLVRGDLENNNTMITDIASESYKTFGKAINLDLSGDVISQVKRILKNLVYV